MIPGGLYQLLNLIPRKTPLYRITTDKYPFSDVFKVEGRMKNIFMFPSKHSGVFMGYFPLFIQEVVIINIQPVSHWPHSTLNMKAAFLPSSTGQYSRFPSNSTENQTAFS